MNQIDDIIHEVVEVAKRVQYEQTGKRLDGLLWALPDVGSTEYFRYRVENYYRDLAGKFGEDLITMLHRLPTSSMSVSWDYNRLRDELQIVVRRV